MPSASRFSRTSWHLFWPLALLLVVPLGCPPDTGSDDDDTVAPPGQDTCVQDSDCSFQSGLEICAEAGVCVHGDRNNSLEEAQLVEDGDVSELYIAPAGDVDWFRFNGTQGDLIYIASTAEDSDNLDTLITYYDSEGTEIGWGDDFDRVSGVSPDSRFYSGVPASGVSYFSVQDKRGWANDPGDPPTGGSGHDYQVFFAYLGGASAARLASEPNDEPALAVDWAVTKYSTNYNLGGGLQPAADVDWISVDVIQGEVLRLYGFPGSGSEGIARVTVYLPDGTSPIRSYDGLAWDAEHRGWVPVLETGTYYLQVQDTLAGGGFDYWYFLHAAKDDPADGFPAEVEPNGSSAEATAVALSIASGESSAETTLWGRIGAAGDEDHFSLTAQANDQLSVSFARTLHGESNAPQVRLVNPAAVLSECGSPAPGDDDDSSGDDDDSAGPTLAACCSDSSCGSVVANSLAWDGGEDAVIAAQALSAGTWDVVVSEVDPAAGGGGSFYQVTIALER